MNTLLYVLVATIILGIVAIMPGDLIAKAIAVIVLLSVAGMSRTVRRVEIIDDNIHVDTLFSSFTVTPSDIIRVSARWSWTNIWFRGRLGPYQLTWGYVSLQELQDLNRRLNEFNKPPMS